MGSIVFVHGAWHKAKIWNRVCDQLTKTGYEGHVTKVELPVGLTGEGQPPVKNMDPDIETIRAAINEELTRSKSVLVVSHSYGSVASNEALKPYAGKGQVKHFIVAGFILYEGETLISARDPDQPIWTEVKGEYVYPIDPANRFYNGFSKELQNELVADLRRHVVAVSSHPMSWVAAKEIPTTMLVCRQDNAARLVHSERMIGKARNVGAELDVRYCDANHSPMVSHPELLAQIINELL